jgi:hypothetical protein
VDPERVVQLLPELTPTHSGAEGINRAGAIVGHSQPSSGVIHAAVWRLQ